MESAPEKLSYWIQRADFTATDFDPVSLSEALAVLRGHDWKAELSYEKTLGASGKASDQSCPPGIGFVADNDHTLHICPRSDGVAECFFIGSPSPGGPDFWERPNASGHEQERFVELLFRRDYATLVEGFTLPVVANVTYWIQRADSTYALNTGGIALAEAQSLLRDYNWHQELVRQQELDEAEKDSCVPTIGFTGPLGSLHVEPDNLGTVDCYLWDRDRQHCWGCGGLRSDEQSRILGLFFRGDLNLTRDWYEFDVESYTDEEGRQLTRAKPAEHDAWLRARWLVEIKQIRARQGRPPELSDEERNLSEHDARGLYVSEARREDEARLLAQTIQAARSELSPNLGDGLICQAAATLG